MRGKHAKQHEPASTKRPVMVSKGHRVSLNITGRTDCGERMDGWTFGTDEDVTCQRECAATVAEEA